MSKSFSGIIITKLNCILGIKSSVGSFQFENRLNTNELILNFYGTAEIHIGGKSLTETADTVRFMPKGDYSPNPYQVEIDQDNYCIDIFFQTAEPVNTGIFCMKTENPKEIRVVFEKALLEWKNKKSGYEHRCIAYVYEILALFEARESGYLPQSKHEKIKSGIDYVENHFADPDFDYTVPGKLCGVSRTYFNRIFSEKFSQSPSEYIQSHRIALACDLLRSGRYSVTQTAEACGYADIYYFSRVFRKVVGESPSQYQAGVK